MLESGSARLVEVPSDDGVLDRSLAELDVKLATWIEAAGTFRVSVAACAETAEQSEQHDDRELERQAAARRTSSSAGGEGPTEQSACDGAHANLNENDRLLEEAGVPDETDDVSRLRVLFESRPEPVPHEAAQGDDEIRAPESETGDQQESQPSSSAEADATEAKGSASDWPAAEEEDNVLLASLDAKTRRDIHVLRRISVERKSIQQLLEEYRAAQGRQSEAQATEPDKRSWWRLSR